MSTPKPTNADRIVVTAAVGRDDDRPERHREHDQRHSDDEEQEERRPLEDPIGDVLERRRQAGDVRDRIPVRGRRRHDVASQPVDEQVGRLVLRSGVGGHEDDRDRLLVVELRLACGGDAVEGLHAVEDPLWRLLVAVDVDDDRDRAVEAGAEALRQQVVRSAAGLRGRLGALVGGAQAHEERRPTHHDDEHEDDREHELGVRGHEPAPASHESPLASLLRVVELGQEGHLQPVDLVPEQRQHGEQERVRDQDGGQHAERGADAELGDEVHAEERETRHRDRHREAGEDHGASGRRARLGRGVSRGEPFVQELPEARDDEERVVDPDPEADHRDQDRGDGVDRRQAGQDEEEQEGRRECHDRERDRDQHRHERAEDDEQDDDRREQAQDLGGSLLDGRELRVTVVLHDHAGRLDRLADRVLHGDDGLAILRRR